MPRGVQGACSVTRFQLTPSSVFQTSLWNASGAGANCGSVWPPMTQILPLNATV